MKKWPMVVTTSADGFMTPDMGTTLRYGGPYIVPANEENALQVETVSFTQGYLSKFFDW